jgi:hypothetical protein
MVGSCGCAAGALLRVGCRSSNGSTVGGVLTYQSPELWSKRRLDPEQTIDAHIGNGVIVAQLSASSGNSGLGYLRDRVSDLWSERDLCSVNLGKIGPMHIFIIEAARERGLHHHEVGRNVEVARRIK